MISLDEEIRKEKENIKLNRRRNVKIYKMLRIINIIIMETIK